MENNNEIINIKKKKSYPYFKNLNENQNYLTEREKIIINIELLNTENDKEYEISLSDESGVNLKCNKLICSEKNNHKYKYNSILDFIFGKEQKILVNMKIKEKNKALTTSTPIKIGQLIGNNKRNKNNTKILKCKGRKEEIKIKIEKMKKKDLFLIVHFKLKIASNKKEEIKEISEEEKIKYFKDEQYKFYYIISKKTGEKIYESEAFTDNGRFNIIQIPIEVLKTDFNIYFCSSKNTFGTIPTNLKDFTDPNKKGEIFFIRRLSNNHNIKIFNYSSIREEITFLDYIHEKIRIGLSIGIDFTISNKNPNDEDSLHCIINGNKKNPYERAMLKCGNILGFYDYDQKFPVYGFGAVVNGTNSDCFNINFENDPNIELVDNIIKSYHECLKKIYFSGPTNFAPLIKNIINEIKIQNDPKEYQVLMILTDGIIQDMENTIDALVEGSFYPLSVIIIGIGDADFSKMMKLDGDEIPLVSRNGIKRQRDLVQFVPFSAYEGDEAKLAHEVLEEIPRQIIEYYTLNFIYPELVNEKKLNINDSVILDNLLEVKDSNDVEKKNDGCFRNATFVLFDKDNDKQNIKQSDDNNYSEINEMFDKINKKKTFIQSSKNENIFDIINISNQISNKSYNKYDFDKIPLKKSRTKESAKCSTLIEE